MAKLFYSLEETAAKLGISEDQITQMAKSGQLQQFRDGESLMFKREQIDAMATSNDSTGLGDTGAIPVAGMGETGEIAVGGADAGDSSGIGLADSGDTGVLDASSGETGEIGLADSGVPALGDSGTDAGATGGDAIDLDAGDSALEGSGIGGSVLGASGLRGSELASGDTIGGTIADVGSSGLLSGLGSGIAAGDGDGDGTGLIDLADGGDMRQSSGISVFDADEIDEADPAAQTIMADIPGSGADQLALESVGSGSGLLDLTREADDTSLGAELLDEIYPTADAAGETTADTVVEPPSETAPGASSGVFEGGVTLEAKDASGVEFPEAVEAVTEGLPADLEPTELAPAPMVSVPGYAEVYDAAGSGLSTGMLMVATAALIVGMIIAFSMVAGFTSALTTALSKEQNTVYIFLGAGIAVALVFGIVGMLVGKILNK